MSHLLVVRCNSTYTTQAFSSPDYSAFLYNAGLKSKAELVKPASPLESKCSAIYAQAEADMAIPPSTQHLPVAVAASEASTLALTRITDLLVALNESNRVLILVSL